MLVVGLGAALAVALHARPSYDAMGWLVWGHQVLHWNLNTDGAPSWKPLTFLFTLPYALTGHSAQLWLWTVTAVTGAVAAVLLAGRLAYRLATGPRWTRLLGAAVAAGGVASLATLLHQTLIANSDPLIVALLLGAIDCHLSGRRRAALALLWLAGLGRPETWALLVLYAAWGVRTRRLAWPLAVGSLAATPVAWFLVPGLTSRSWFSPGDLALGHMTAIHGNKLIGVLDRLRLLTAPGMQIAVAAGLVVVLIANRRAAGVAALAAVWVAVEVIFALRGFSAVQRYLLEPGALLSVVAGTGVATVLSPRGVRRIPGVLAVLALIAAVAPFARSTLRTDHGILSQARYDATRLDRLAALLVAEGGPRPIRACGQPVATLGLQSTLGFFLDMNVGDVGWRPGRAIDSGQPIVFFRYTAGRWRVRAIHPAPASAARCAELARTAAAHRYTS